MKRLFCLKAKNGLGRFAPSTLPLYETPPSKIVSCNPFWGNFYLARKPRPNSTPVVTLPLAPILWRARGRQGRSRRSAMCFGDVSPPPQKNDPSNSQPRPYRQWCCTSLFARSVLYSGPLGVGNHPRYENSREGAWTNRHRPPPDSRKGRGRLSPLALAGAERTGENARTAPTQNAKSVPTAVPFYGLCDSRLDFTEIG